MRLSEATHIRLSDIDSDRIQIRIDLGKGGKSRMVQMPASLLELLRSYYKAYKPEIYLFNGNKKGKVYSSSSARWAIRRAIKLSGKEIRCNLHMLRNCYATHHLELGTDLVYLQEQMGHKHLKTTAKYIRRVTKPTMETGTIEMYLARYIKKVAVTNSRVKYVRQTEEVRLVYNDYRNQKEGEPAPKAEKGLMPLVFIHQYMQHVPPPYFQKVRYYGIHSSASQGKVRKRLPKLIRKNGQTIRTVFEIVTEVMKLPTLKCDRCGHMEFSIELIKPDKEYIYKFINRHKIRSP